MENNQNQIDEEKKKKKKRILLIIFAIAFLVPIGFGIYNLIPDPVPPTRSYSVELKDNYNNGLTLSKNIAYPDYNFVTDIALNRSIITDKVMPDALGEGDVLCLNKPITYTYKVNQDKFSAHLTIPKENIKGNITINVPLATPTKSFLVTLKANGGKFNHGGTTIYFTAHVGERLNEIQGYEKPNNFREGYHFTHWEFENNRSLKLKENDFVPYIPEGLVLVANCELNEIKMHIFPNGGAFPGMAIDQTLDLDTLYDATINQIPGYPGEPMKEGHQFLYYVDTGNNKFYPTSTVTIPNELNDNFLLQAVYAENLNITLSANGGTFPEGAATTFNTHKGITLSELEDYKEPTKANQDFTYWSYNGTRYYGNSVLNLSGDITLTANYENCEHTDITSYTVVNNKLYGICDECGAQVLITDSELSHFTDKFLWFNGVDYDMFSIDYLPTLVSNAETHEKLDIYLINGAYDLDCNRPTLETLVTVNVHGLLNNSGELNASVNCSNLVPEYPRFYLNVDFVFNNLIMNGADEGFLYEVGLKAHYITYNNCYFTKMQSLHSEQVIFNNCYFDATTHPGDPEYSIYSYNSYNVEFYSCEFLSRGKAVKIYSEGAAAGATFKFADCHFHIEEGFPSTLVEKAAIEVDSTVQKQEGNPPYNVYISNCTQVGYNDFGSEDHNGLYHDKASYANFIVTNE